VIKYPSIEIFYNRGLLLKYLYFYNSNITPLTAQIINNQISNLIAKSIQEGKYLSISYKNKKEEHTDFWVSVLDINAHDELIVNMFNVSKPEPILNATIRISRITRAEILKFSQYNVPYSLVNKIQTDESLEVYNFEKFDTTILSYYLECYRAGANPFLHKQHLIPEIDLHQFQENHQYRLSDAQQHQIIKEIYADKYQQNIGYDLAICEFSIDITGKGKYIVAYKKLSFDPIEKTLKISLETYFNPSFYLHNIQYSLSYFSDISPDDFEKMYKSNSLEAIELIKSNFSKGELPNTRPEIVVLGYAQIDISDIYEQINTDFNNNTLELPLKALFQQLSFLDTKNRTKPKLVLYDKNINIDQLRTIYNALKYPITYVQGPPGTGKTQTILNIVVNCFTSNKTLLISSNNNVPIDGIYEKLSLGKYADKEIMFPMLRLGNYSYTLEALDKIKKWFEYDSKESTREDLLYDIRKRASENNAKLDQHLENLDILSELNQNLEFIEALLKKGENPLILNEKQKIERKKTLIPDLNEEELIDIFEVIKGNQNLEHYFYFESLKYLKKLKQKNYSELFEIIYIKDEKDRVKKFNRWLREDENIKLLLRVFPVILNTNLSSKKLGNNFKFDLLVIDEAGQCDIATSLIPISKCKNMVLIGDTNQLKPIINVEERLSEKLMHQFKIKPEYNYTANSILSLYKNIDHISRNILLSYHYRCGRKIINFSNQRFYEQKLKLDRIQNTGEIKLLDVQNKNSVLKNSQIEEALEIIQFVKDNNLKDTFILTPFRDQRNVIQELLNRAIDGGEIFSSVKCGTIHQVQGQENSTIILSTSISQRTHSKTYDWIKNNSQLINVGITRAKEKLIVFADTKAIDILSRKDDDLFALVQYIKNNGQTKVTQSQTNKFTIGFSNDSKFEDEFYKTMQHFCSVQGSRFERNVKVAALFPQLINNPTYKNKEFDGVLYQSQAPRIVFEIDGSEHYSRKKTINADKLKSEIAIKNNLSVIKIPNQYVRHYEYISNLIGKINGQSYQTSLFEFEIPF
jgi:superfamily I DNA and/or RNA helicase